MRVPGTLIKTGWTLGTITNGAAETPTVTGVQATGDGTAVLVTNAKDGSYSTLVIQLEGISGDTITFEGTIDGSTWYALLFTPLTTGTAATTATADGLYRATVTGLKQVRSRVSTYSAGTIIGTYVLTA